MWKYPLIIIGGYSLSYAALRSCGWIQYVQATGFSSEISVKAYEQASQSTSGTFDPFQPGDSRSAAVVGTNLLFLPLCWLERVYHEHH